MDLEDGESWEFDLQMRRGTCGWVEMTFWGEENSSGGGGVVEGGNWVLGERMEDLTEKVGGILDVVFGK